MTAQGDGAPESFVPDPFEDALTAARLCAIDPALGGMVLRGGGDARDVVIAELRRGLATDAPMRRMPAHIDDDRLLGGIDLTATLSSGRAVMSRGLLDEVDGGVLVVPMAERLSDATAGRLAAVSNGGETRFVCAALDDGVEPDERPPAGFCERLAFWIDLSQSSPVRGGGPLAGRSSSGATSDSRAERPLHHAAHGPPPRAGEDILTALVATAGALGIDSIRAPIFALRAARAAARLEGRENVSEADVTLAARLVLGPRATRMPAPAEPETTDDAPPPPPESTDGEDDRSEPGPLEDQVLAAALASLPRDLLAKLAAGRGRKASRASGAGERRTSSARGRPMGARAGMPGGGLRLSLIDTLRAAAPWQRLRGGGGSGEAARIRIRRDDLRIRRFETRAQALTIFAVDASGSSALARLAEAKGAVELLLAEAYVKRAEVALIAFRGTAAELLLPPTRSLARAKRSLGDLPGGGGTPLAAGLAAARDLAAVARGRGKTPFVVVLTDGRANIAADGTAVRARAESDALAAARAIREIGVACAFVDISARPRPEGAALAQAMGARYLPLPRADATAMHAAVAAVQPE